MHYFISKPLSHSPTGSRTSDRMALVYFQLYSDSFYKSHTKFFACPKSRCATYCSLAGNSGSRLSRRNFDFSTSVSYTDREHITLCRRDRSVASSCATSGDNFSPESASVETSLREELAALLKEMDETQRRAGSARSRFMRLTEAVEKLRDSASSAVKAGNEAAGRRNLEEKGRVMNALENARQRAGVLETLAGKLREAISRKESVLIATIYSAKASISSTSSSQVHVVSPSSPSSDAAAPGSAEYLRSLSDDELRAQFFLAERAELERMLLWRQSKEGDQKPLEDTSHNILEEEPEQKEKEKERDEISVASDTAHNSSPNQGLAEVKSQSEACVESDVDIASDTVIRVTVDSPILADAVKGRKDTM